MTKNIRDLLDFYDPSLNLWN